MGRIYLESNGITIKCENCVVGEKLMFNGEEERGGNPKDSGHRKVHDYNGIPRRQENQGSPQRDAETAKGEGVQAHRGSSRKAPYCRNCAW